MRKNKVLIIDDDEQIIKILRDYFQYENFEVISALDGKEGLKKAKEKNPDVIILDIMLPELEGWEVCKRIRQDNNIPIIILSAKNTDTDRIDGIELGADDYITKPFSPKEVVVRAKAVLRRVNNNVKDDNFVREYPNLVIRKEQREVKINNEMVKLTPKEFDLLWTLSSHPKKVYSRDELLKKVWGYDYFGDVRTVDTHIKSLRKKLGESAGKYIKTVWGVGYKFEVLK
ncbi:MAG: response regulator transcription factor [Bacillota bacterium]